MRAFPLVLARIGDEWKSMGFQWTNRNSKKGGHFHLFQHELEMNGNQWDVNGKTGIEKMRAFPFGLPRIGY